MRYAIATLGALLLVEVGGGCGGDGAGDASPLEGVPWVLSAGVDVAGWDGVAPSAHFDGGRLAGSTGCNRYGAPYTVDGDTLELGEIASTLMACPPPADAVERAYVGALGRAVRWSTEDGELVLLDVEDVELLRFAAGTPAGSWVATGFLQGDGVTSPIAGTEITASFAEDGALTGTAGCNNYTTSFAIDRRAIEIAPAATTRKLCSEPAGVMQQEAAYLAALVEAERFSLGGGTLELQRADGTSVAVFARSR